MTDKSQIGRPWRDTIIAALVALAVSSAVSVFVAWVNHA